MQIRNCFVCNTPLLLMNCINIAENFYASSDYVNDLYLSLDFRGAQEVWKRLEEQKIFDHIFVFQSYHEGKNEFCMRVYRLLFPKTYMKHNCLSNHFTVYEYDTLFVNHMTCLVRNLLWILKYKTVNIYEDGIGSYDGAIFQDTPLSVKILDRLFHGKRLEFKAQKSYLNHPQCFTLNTEAQLVKIPNLSEDNTALEKIYNVFTYQPNDMYQKHRFIYLAEILSEWGDASICANEIPFLDALKSLGEDKLKDWIVRMHPRQNKSEYPDFCSDELNNLWELECAEQITDNSVLVAYYSTALTAPVMFYDKKPYLIFLYKAFGSVARYESGMNHIVKVIKELYGEQSYKVMLPDSVEDAVKQIMQVQNEK